MLIKKHYHFALWISVKLSTLSPMLIYGTCKLENLVISGRTIEVVKKLYRHAKARVSINGRFSEEFLCNVGVRQGCPLSPLLSFLFINDLMAFMKVKVSSVRISQ